MRKKPPKNRALATELLALGGSIAVPLVFLCLWHLRNVAYPKNDAGFYCVSGQETYLISKAEGLIAAIRSAYFHRHWKPILFPPLLAPFLAATGGQVLTATALALGLFYTAFLAYAYAIFRAFLPPLRAFFGAVVLAAWPWVFGAATTYFAELPFYVCILAALFHASRCQLFRRTGHGVALGVALALALCFRPVEAVLVFLVPVGVFVGVAVSRRDLRLRDLIPLVGWLLVVSLLIVLPIRSNYAWSSGELSIFMVLGALFCCVNAYACRALGLSAAFQGCGIALFAIFSIWYAPFSLGLYDWIFHANFGSLKRDHVTTGREVGKFLLEVYRSAGILPVLALVAGAFGNRGHKPLRGWGFAIALTGMVTLPILAGCLTENNDVRYYSAIWLILLVYGLIQVLAPVGRWSRIRLVAVGLIAGLELLFLTSILFQFAPPFNQETFFAITGKAWWNLNPPIYEPMLELHKGIAKRVPNRPITRFNVFSTHGPSALSGANDPWSLTLRSREIGLPWVFDRFWRHDDEPEAVQLEGVRLNYRYLVVGPVDGDEPALFDPSARLAKFVIRIWRRSGLEKAGLTLIDRIQVHGEDGSLAEYLLLNTNRADYPFTDPYH